MFTSLTASSSGIAGCGPSLECESLLVSMSASSAGTTEKIIRLGAKRFPVTGTAPPSCDTLLGPAVRNWNSLQHFLVVCCHQQDVYRRWCLPSLQLPFLQSVCFRFACCHEQDVLTRHDTTADGDGGEDDDDNDNDDDDDDDGDDDCVFVELAVRTTVAIDFCRETERL